MPIKNVIDTSAIRFFDVIVVDGHLRRQLATLAFSYLAPGGALFFFFQAEDGIRDLYVTGVQPCALPIYTNEPGPDRQPAGISCCREPGAFLLLRSVCAGIGLRRAGRPPAPAGTRPASHPGPARPRCDQPSAAGPAAARSAVQCAVSCSACSAGPHRQA